MDKVSTLHKIIIIIIIIMIIIIIKNNKKIKEAKCCISDEYTVHINVPAIHKLCAYDVQFFHDEHAYYDLSVGSRLPFSLTFVS